MDKYFNNKSVRLFQKEKLFYMLFKNAFNQESIKLNEELYLIDNDLRVDIKIPDKVYLVDITNSFYIDDNVDIIVYYEKYRIESLDAYSKLYESNKQLGNKNDSTDI